MHTEPHDALAKALADQPLTLGRFDQLQAEQLSDTGLIDALVAVERLVCYTAGLQARVLGALAARQEDEDDLTAGLVESEVCAATRWAPVSAQRRLDESWQLVSRFPETLELLQAGQVCRGQAAALCELTGHLEVEAARAVQARVLARMPKQSVAATRKNVHRALLALDPQGAAVRHEREAKRRRVVLYPEPDGMATLALYTPAATGAALLAAIDAHAKTRVPGDERGVDQRRADALTGLVLGSGTVQSNWTQYPDTRIPALIQITVGIDTLLGSSDEPATLQGYGPIGAVQARQIAIQQDATWRRLLTSPEGVLLHTDPHTYRPTASVERLVRMRDQHCTFPGCTRPARRCDLDHITAFDHQNPEAGGATTPENLHALCRRHHRLKTAGAWRPVRREGHMLWISRTGHTYTTVTPTYADE